MEKLVNNEIYKKRTVEDTINKYLSVSGKQD